MTFGEARELFDYDPESGWLLWKVTDRRRRAGMRAGSPSTRQGYTYRVVKANNQRYLEHRVIWLWVTGEWPGIVDHIDGDPSNNSWGNLREATRGENIMNSRLQQRNKSGVKGVVKQGGRWGASVTANGKRMWLGTFDTIEEAAAIVRAKREELHGEFARHE